MKVSKIHLKNYLNFELDLIIDLTYPIDHPKHGEPLEKVCFIGQSGTGKTSLLNLVKFFSFEKEPLDRQCLSEELIRDSVEIFYQIADRNFSKHINNEGYFEYFENSRVQNSAYQELIYSQLNNSKPWIISFPFNIIENSNSLPNTAHQEKIIASTIFKIEEGILEKKKKAASQNVWDFSIHNIRELWDIVFDDITIYKSKFLQERNKFFLKAEKDIDKAKKYLQELNKWKSTNHNPIKELANGCLNEILKKFNLEVKTDLNYDDESDLQFIKLQQIKGENNIPYKFLSTGTKQILLTAIPLYVLKPKNAIIIFDQPENSLYPDIQTLIVEEYAKLTDNSQFFYATHSPILASSFEPWEIKELYFNEETGKVSVKKYFTGENSIKNYKINAQLLPWNLIYSNFFGIKEDGNSKVRNPQIDRLAYLKRDLQNASPESKLSILAEIQLLSDSLGVNLSTFFQRIKNDAEN